MELREHIRRLLEEQHLSVRALSQKSGVRRPSIAAFLAGANIHLDNLQKMLAALGKQLALGPLGEMMQSLSQGRCAVDRRRLRALCRKHRIRRLSLFGSILRPDFTPESDIDLLIEFEKSPSLFELAAIEEELAAVFPKGHQLDVVTEQTLSPYLRKEVMAAKEVLYEKAA